jgi:PAS domain S-box-containing protein
MKSTDDPEAILLRKRALKLLKKRTPEQETHLAEADVLKLVHELEVHQIELELQNEELKLAKERQAELATEKYVALYDFAPSGYLTLSRDGRIVDLNLSGAKIIGKDRLHLRNSSFGFFVSTDNQPIFNKFLSDVFSRKFKQTCEVALKSFDNLPRYVYLSGIIDEQSNHCLLTMVDITDRKRAEEDLRKSEEKYRSIFENVQDIFYQIDLNGKIIDISPSVKNYSEYVKADLIGSSVYDLYLTPDERAKFLEELNKTGEVRDYELTIKTKSGGIKYTAINARLIYDSEGHPDHIDGMIRDITERVLVNQELNKALKNAEESDRLKSAFLANMSHEIRTPLNGILGFAELLEDVKLSEESRLHYVKVIRNSGIRMLNIINDIIDISKIEAGQIKASAKETNINELTHNIYSLFRPEVEAKRIRFIVRNSLPFEKAYIQTDEEKVYAIFSNLVKNAIKFTNKGQIEFGYIFNAKNTSSGSADLKDGMPKELVFFVKDTGIGIPEEKLGIVFERFRQVNDTQTRNFEGAGLGLSISKAYVEMLGGKIWVESEYGKGSEFYFTIPYIAQPKIESEKKVKIIPKPEVESNKKYKILVVEDDKYSEMLLTLAVETFSKKYFKVKSGIDAVETCRKNPDLDLILMDIRLPEMDGYEATRQIRQFNKNVTIIAQTAFGQPSESEKALESGFSDYIAKPLSVSSLVSVMKKYLVK